MIWPRISLSPNTFRAIRIRLLKLMAQLRASKELVTISRDSRPGLFLGCRRAPAVEAHSSAVLGLEAL